MHVVSHTVADMAAFVATLIQHPSICIHACTCPLHACMDLVHNLCSPPLSPAMCPAPCSWIRWAESRGAFIPHDEVETTYLKSYVVLPEALVGELSALHAVPGACTSHHGHTLALLP